MNQIRIREVTKDDLVQFVKNEDLCVVYLYTPLCGTCKIGEKMLDVALAALGDMEAVKCNVNAMGDTVFDWEITSVPALLVFVAGTMVVKEYAVRSVDHLYQLLLRYTLD